ncbi:hypothetical protein ACIBQ2_14995 [Micromonospora sediminimaris]|uniref:Secreted protein n=1 Tax=Micromonospora sediminimaris TaxID=547162 RepID=A0A9W5US64_9ACTN|nr:hypothetical protein [Micromonospora sediminimaris]GIJ33476.1 hypothetical protein Vse01_26240 [Micromonospora sediminimaris]SFC92583.1 hypothetical protein SAMN05216284_108271 [Micromonospora sediminimaris]
MIRALLRAATVLAAALLATTVMAGSAAAVPISQRFSVPSGDNCTYGYTEGVLEWRSTAPTKAVRLTGVVVDRPSANEPIFCRDDRRYTIASYVAYAGERPIDRAAQRVDNGVLRFDFVLDSDAWAVGIDRVVIQVCRTSLDRPSTVPDYCGREYTFRPTSIGPNGS